MHSISGEDLSFLVFTYFCTKNPPNFWRKAFSCFVCTSPTFAVLDIIFVKIVTSQRVTPQNPVPGATILSIAYAYFHSVLENYKPSNALNLAKMLEFCF